MVILWKKTEILNFRGCKSNIAVFCTYQTYIVKIIYPNINIISNIYCKNLNEMQNFDLGLNITKSNLILEYVIAKDSLKSSSDRIWIFLFSILPSIVLSVHVIMDFPPTR